MAKVLVVSPHLDDAVLSYGGQLARLARSGDRVTVYTVFAGTPAPPYSPVAEAFHARWGLTGDPVAPRREEDDHALSLLGVGAVRGAYLDSIYRRDAQGGWLIEDQDPMQYAGDDETALVHDVASAIALLIGELAADRVVTCAAIGNHVDHRRARDAALEAGRRTGVPLALWDDFPYVAWPEIDAVVPPLPAWAASFPPTAAPVCAQDWEARNRAIRCYASQLAMLEADGVPLDRVLAEHCDARRDRYAVDGFYEVVRDVSAARLPAGRTGRP